jgi:hypothetical protein
VIAPCPVDSISSGPPAGVTLALPWATMDMMPAPSGLDDVDFVSTPLSSPRRWQQQHQLSSAITLPQAHFRPMDVTLKLRSAVYFADATKARLALLAGADVNAANPESNYETVLVRGTGLGR